MHRLKSPLAALLVMLLLTGPLLGRITQIDPTDPYQVSTPSPWERSQGLAPDQPTIELEFHHGVQLRDDPRTPLRKLEDQVLLFSESRVVSLNRETLAINWDIELPMWADVAQVSEILDGLTGEESRHVIVGNDTSHAMIDVDTGLLEWHESKPTDAASTEYKSISRGLLLHEQTDEYDDRIFQVLDGSSGEILTVVNVEYPPTSKDFGEFAVIDGDYEVFAMSSDTGEVLWSRPFSKGNQYAVAGERVTILAADDEILALDSSTGQELWLVYVRPGYNIRTINSSMVALEYQDQLVSFDLETGLAIQTLPHDQDGGLDLRILGERVFHTDGSGVAVHDLRSGTEVWRVDAPVYDIEQHNDPGWAAVDSSSGEHAVYDTTTGDLLWRGIGSLGKVTDESLLRLTSDEVALLDALTGEAIWGYVTTEPTRPVSITSKYVVLATGRQFLWLDAKTGHIVQQAERHADDGNFWIAGRAVFEFNDNGVTLRDPVSGQDWELTDPQYEQYITWGYDGDFLYVAFGEFSENGRLWVFELSTGRIIWSDVVIEDWSDLSGSDGVAIVYERSTPDSRVGLLRRLDPDGTIAWETPIQGDVNFVARSAEQRSVLVSLGLGLIVLDAESGEVILQTDTSNDVGENWTPGSSDWILVADGLVFEPGMTVSRVYRTSAAPAEALAEDTVLRGAPSAESIERGTFAAGTHVTRTGNERSGTNGRWLEIIVDGTTGWVPREALIDTEPIDVATPESDSG